MPGLGLAASIPRARRGGERFALAFFMSLWGSAPPRAGKGKAGVARRRPGVPDLPSLRSVQLG